MKMSFFWLLITCIDVVNVVIDVVKGDYGFWFYADIVLIGLALWLYVDARKRELQEEAKKKQLINIFINNVSPEDAEASAQRVAERMKYEL